MVSAWVMDRGELKEVDLFSGLQWNHDRAHGHENSVPLSPSLYVGMHRKQVRLLDIHCFSFLFKLFSCFVFLNF